MSYEVNFGPLVKFDLADAYDWYEGQEEGLGERFLDAFDSRVELIRENPIAFPSVHGDLRRSLLRRFPYLVFYRVKGGCGHGSRLLPRPTRSKVVARPPVTADRVERSAVSGIRAPLEQIGRGRAVRDPKRE